MDDGSSRINRERDRLKSCMKGAMREFDDIIADRIEEVNELRRQLNNAENKYQDMLARNTKLQKDRNEMKAEIETLQQQTREAKTKSTTFSSSQVKPVRQSAPSPRRRPATASNRKPKIENLLTLCSPASDDEDSPFGSPKNSISPIRDSSPEIEPKGRKQNMTGSINRSLHSQPRRIHLPAGKVNQTAPAISKKRPRTADAGYLKSVSQTPVGKTECRKCKKLFAPSWVARHAKSCKAKEVEDDDSESTGSRSEPSI